MSAAPSNWAPQPATGLATRLESGLRTEQVAHAGRWSVVPEVSEARFHVRDKLLSTVHGLMPVEHGTATVSGDGDLAEAWVDVSVGGIATGNTHRDKDLRKPAFLDAATHPAVRVEIQRATPTPAGWTAVAVVNARGRQAPLELIAETVADSDREIRVRVTGRLDRMPLGIKAPTFIVGRVLDLEADLTFRRDLGGR